MELQPLDKLLCNILGKASDETLTASFRQLPAADWDALLQKAEEHVALLLVYRRIKAPAVAGAVPAETLEKLSKKYYENIRRNSIYYHEFAKIFTSFNNGSVPAIPLKGSYLTDQVYRNIGVRDTGDLDILVHQADLPAVEAALQELGYKSRPYWLEAENELSHSLPPFFKNRAPILDVHWTFENPDNPFAIDMDGVWQRAQRKPVAGCDALTLAAEDLLLHLCLHATYHHRLSMHLRSICDIRETIRAFGETMDWDAFRSRAAEWRVEKSIFLALMLAEELLGTRAPSQIMDSLRPAGFDGQIMHFALEQIFPGLSSSLAVSAELSRFWEAKTLHGKAVKLLQVAFPSRSFMSMRYPAAPSSFRIYLYYPARIIHLFSRFGRTMWLRLRRHETAMEPVQREMDANQLERWLSSVN